MNQSILKQPHTLGVALSTRGFGFVVMEGEKTIIELGGRKADGDKNAQSITKLEKLFTSYQPNILLLQDVEAKDSRRAPRIKALTRRIKEVAAKRKIPVKLISATQLRVGLLGDPKGTRHEMAEALARQFPDKLASRLPAKRKVWKSEDGRMDIFDAMALAVVYFMKSK